jgi:hypothetical protein
VSKFLEELVNDAKRRILRVGEKNPNVTRGLINDQEI